MKALDLLAALLTNYTLSVRLLGLLGWDFIDGGFIHPKRATTTLRWEEVIALEKSRLLELNDIFRTLDPRDEPCTNEQNRVVDSAELAARIESLELASKQWRELKQDVALLQARLESSSAVINPSAAVVVNNESKHDKRRREGEQSLLSIFVRRLHRSIDHIRSAIHDRHIEFEMNALRDLEEIEMGLTNLSCDKSYSTGRDLTKLE